MRVAVLLESRRRQWLELERLCAQLENRSRRSLGPQAVARFAALYRAACADLALADAHQLPANTVEYLHQLVGRAHNQLYRSRTFRLAQWARELLYEVPRRLYSDNALRLAFVLFWGVFLASMVLASGSRDFAEQVLSADGLTHLEAMYSQPISQLDPDERAAMVGFYILNNTGIGLRCFAFGVLFGVGGLFLTISNALVLGASFGHMSAVPQWRNFFEFVTAHGPFELTAIVLSAGAGMKLGFALISTRGLTRRASLDAAAAEAMPTMGAAMIMFFLAALIEGFLSPSPAPYWVKAGTAALSGGLLLFYFVLLGRPREAGDAA